MNVDEIIVDDRQRRDVGDLDALIESIRRIGLLHPIVVGTDNRLKVGYRRLMAYKKAGWKDIPATVTDRLDDIVLALEAERDENIQRLDLPPSLIVKRAVELEKAEREAAKKRQGTRTDLELPGNFPESRGQARDRVASAFGISGRTYEKAKAVVEAAEDEPNKYGSLIEVLDKSVDLAYRILQQERAAEKRAKKVVQIREQYSKYVWLGDFRALCDRIPPESVDLIFTDPPYLAGEVETYYHLSEMALRVLRPGGICMAYAGQFLLPDVIAAATSFLEFMWIAGVRHTGGDLRFRKYKIHNAWKPIVMCYKPPLEAWWDWWSDMTTGGREKDLHEWQQAEAEAAYYIEALSPPGGLVLDPMCGSGTTLVAAHRLGRQYLGIDKDPDAVNKTIERLHDAATT